MNKIEVVIDSWGSYVACNSRALGSEWIDLSRFNDFEEIKKELANQGFKLNEIDEELFIQNVCSTNHIISNIVLAKYNAKTVINAILKSKILKDDYLFALSSAIIEINGFDDFLKKVESDGANFGDCYIFYQDQTIEDVAYDLANEFLEINKSNNELLQRYFNYEEFARDLEFDGYYETKTGVLVYC